MNFLRSCFASLAVDTNKVNPHFCFHISKTWTNQMSKSRSLFAKSHFISALAVFDDYSQRHILIRNLNSGSYNTISHGEFTEPEAPSESHVGLTPKHVISWTATISSFARSNRPENAIEMFKLMLVNDQKPNYVTLLSVIRAVGSMGWEEMIRGIHGFVIKHGFGSEVSLVTALVGLYSVHDMKIVWQLFDGTPTKDLVLWSAMIAACSKNGQSVEALEIFRQMQYEGEDPNHISIVSVLPACADLGALSLGKQIHGYSIKRELSLFTNVQNSLVDMYAKCGKLKVSILLFNGIVNKDIVSWNTMICRCLGNGFPGKALDLFSNMRSSCLEPDETAIRNALGACSQLGEFEYGLGLHCYVIKDGFLPLVPIGTALLRMYAKFGDVDSAETLFANLHEKDLIAWSAMISVYAQAGYPYDALDTFKQMQLVNVKPNEVTLVSLLQACSSMGAQEHGKSVHACTVRLGYSSNLYITSALIDFYCKLGRLNQGKALFDKLPIKDLICWSSMINGYGVNGCGKEALETFSDMLECGTKPNDIVFVSVLSACSHCGLEDEAWNWFYSMEEKYGVVPTVAHYACMVDLLSRRGRIEEALGFIKEMPMQPNASVWGALLTGCRLSQSPIEVIEFAAKHLLNLDALNTSYLVILSNLYAEHGRWRDVERLRRLVKEKGLRKTGGYSLVEAN
ncbi:pentatricopeptide repeat-containing protein At1g11290, chloroplastic-like [Telopea speciosissima]|uniref:pentatricopeptide repeat-containing protein At1g11290, chloroplastic-like n=1 Tax=Telopea speciosissima TaxID=54955 RepID=UPI001CC6A4E3|nr:pentatricopeptide repeat-containing protein At1g11290, chloroplastic-like [Telopea speciosissima]